LPEPYDTWSIALWSTLPEAIFNRIVTDSKPKMPGEI